MVAVGALAACAAGIIAIAQWWPFRSAGPVPSITKVSSERHLKLVLTADTNGVSVVYRHQCPAA